MRHFSLFFGILLLPFCLFGGFSHVSGKWSPERYVPIFSVHEHYDRGYLALNQSNWEEALVHFMVINYHYTDSPFYPDALFYSGVCFFNKNDLDLANKQFDRYLALGSKLKHFEKVFEFKLEIADRYSDGLKKHILGIEKLPKWVPAKADALALYDEIVAAFPGQSIAATAMYNKADLLKEKRQYRDSIEVLQILTRRFPKESLAAKSYLRISEIYLNLSQIESQNPDLIALAQVNIQRFAKSFPADGSIGLAKDNLQAMREVYAQSLYDTGRFYERKKKTGASCIYYADTIRKYPGTTAAIKSEERLAKLGQKKMNAA